MRRYMCNSNTEDILEFESAMKLNRSKIVRPEQNNNIIGTVDQITESIIPTRK